jgi:hypothetical protein
VGGDAGVSGRRAGPGWTIRRFEDPDAAVPMELGAFARVALGGMTVGRAEYAPGWRWSEHVGKALGQALCPVAHVGLVVSGRNRVIMADGTAFDIGPGDLFEIGPGHDSVVLGDEPYVSIHLLGAAEYGAGDRSRVDSRD